MNQKVLIGVIVGVVIVLALPVILNIAGITPAATLATAPQAPVPVSTPPPPQQAPQAAYTPPAMPAVPPAGGLDANSLIGTAWTVNTPYGPVQVQLNAGGQLTANHSLIGAIPGTWSLQGNRLVANASAMGHYLNIDATIQGNTILFQGQPLMRLR